MINLSVWERVTLVSNAVASRAFWLVAWVYFFSNFYATKEIFSSLEPLLFTYILFDATTWIQLNALEALKFQKMISGFPRGLDEGNFREVDVREALDTLKVGYHDIIEAGGWKKGFSARKDTIKAMAALADRNTFFVSHAAHPYVRVRLFESLSPMASSMAYYGFLRPTIVLFRDKLDSLSTFQKFELLHELGHGTHKGQYNFGFFWVYLEVFIVTGIVILSVVDTQDFIHVVPMLVAHGVFVFWFLTSITEDESRADSFALQNMAASEHQKLRSQSEKFEMPEDPALNNAENKARRTKLITMISRFRRTARGTHLFHVDYDADQTGLPSTAVELAKYGGSTYKILSLARLLSLIYAFQYIGTSFDRGFWLLIPIAFIFVSALLLVQAYQDRALSSRLRVNSLRDQSHLYFASK